MVKMIPAKKGKSLLNYRKNVMSQFGEDGVLAQVFRIIPPSKTPWCVEFGAGDGKWMSNTWNLIRNRKWHAVLIEAEETRYQELLQEHKQSLSRIVPIRTFVTFSGKDSLDNIFARTPIPKDFDLLSIDIDGNDYHVWDSMRKYRPKVVIIEFNPSIPSDVTFIQPRDMMVRQGASLRALVELGKTKGYELVYAQDGNAILVRKELFSAFGIADNSVEALYSDRKYETRVFQLFDGTLKYEGNRKLIWCDVEIEEKRLQMLPRSLRKFSDNRVVVIILLMRLLRLRKPYIRLRDVVQPGRIKGVVKNMLFTKWER